MTRGIGKQFGPVMIMAGGTGGHVFPALAVANELRDRGIEVVWMGTRHGLEAKLVPEQGFDIEWISIAGLRGKKIGRLLSAPFMLMLAAWQSMRVIMRQKPRLVLGMGGFVSGPGGFVARLMGKPLCIHEQNAYAGLTNRILSRIASRVMEAFPGSFPKRSDVILTGNPVRQEIASLDEPEVRMQGRSGALRLLVLGGSLGARALNEVVPQAMALLPTEQRPVVKHQVGVRNYESAHSYYQECGMEAELLPFIDDMSEAYAWADLVLCRAGALTISELTAAGIAALLVPYPYAVDDHQTLNARFLVNAGAAVLIPQSELSPQRLVELLKGFIDGRNLLLDYAKAARALARPDATRDVVDICLHAAGVDKSPDAGVSPQ